MIYLVHAKSAGKVKIGISCDVESRFNQLKAGSPVELTLVATIDVGDDSLERELHKKYADHRSHGEWFDDVVIEKILADFNDEHKRQRVVDSRAVARLEKRIEKLEEELGKIEFALPYHEREYERASNRLPVIQDELDKARGELEVASGQFNTEIVTPEAIEFRDQLASQRARELRLSGRN